MPTIQELKDYVSNKAQNLLGSDTINYNGNDYEISSLVVTPWLHLYGDAIRENAAGGRAIKFPGAPYPVSGNNGNLITAVGLARTRYQRILDIWFAILAQIDATTVTSYAQIDTNWDSLSGAYTIAAQGRVAQPTLEALSAAIGAGNTDRDYITYNGAGGNPAARAFNTTYTPSTTNDVFLIFPFSQTSVLLGSATCTLLVNGAQADVKGLSGVAATQTDSFTVIVPKGKTYRVNNTATGLGSGNTVGVVKELLL